MQAESWYVDPYGVHEDRWFSAGTPTSLVRDGGLEAKEPPPGAVPAGPLVPSAAPIEGEGADDLKRADDAEREEPTENPIEAALDAFARFEPPS